MKGVLDRIEDGIAVILLEEENEECILSTDELPAGSAIGTWFNLTYVDEKVTIISIDNAETERANAKSVLVMKKLQKKKKTSKFKRN